MLQFACSTLNFPLTLTLSLREREQQASDGCLADGCWANSGTSLIERLSDMKLQGELYHLVEERVVAKTSTGQEAHFEQNDSHPDPLPSDGRGNSRTRLSQLPKFQCIIFRVQRS